MSTISIIQVYRRKRKSSTWHFCSNCRHWPEADYETTREKPKASEICNQCKAKRFNENCKATDTASYVKGV